MKQVSSSGFFQVKVAVSFALCFAGVLLAMMAWSSAAGPKPTAIASKIAPEVLAETADGNSASIVILLADQADVSAAHEMKDQDARGWFVYNTLTQHAARTQAGLRAELEGRGVSYQSFWAANMIVATADRALIESLAARGDVARIDSNNAARWIEPPEIANFSASANAPAAPETVEWGVQNVNAPAVWALGFTGQGMVIGDQDTGARWTHAALKPKYRGWDGATANHNYNWHDAIHTGGGVCGPNTVAPCDDSGHGTHTAGTTVGDDGSGNQVGVAPGAKWIGCRNMDQGNGTPARYTECFQFMMAPTDLNGNNADPTLRAHVLNNSWGCPASEGCTTGAELETIVNNTQAAGIFVVVSAGNSGSGCSTVSDAPAIYEASFSVGAYDINNTLANFSSRGPSTYPPNVLKPNISAPGVTVRSSYYSSDTSYANLSGTSMAGPHVVGAVALLWSARPALARDIAATKTLLQNTANPSVIVTAQTCGLIPSTQIPNNSFGYGRLDILAAVNAAASPTPTPTASATATATATATVAPTATAAATATPTSTPCVTNPIVTTNADSGPGSLRQAVADACPGSTITFNMKQVVSPITLTSGAVVVNKSLTISGPGANQLTISAELQSSLFQLSVPTPGVVTFSGLTLRRGSTALINAGTGTLAVVDCALNDSLDVSGPDGGGAISNRNTGVVNIFRDTFTNNTASFGGGAIDNASTGTINISDSTFVGNRAQFSRGGGALQNRDGVMNITNSTLSGNTATDGLSGGAIYNGNSGTVTLSNSTVSNNTAGFGGGIAGNTVSTSQIKNSIVALNSASSGPDLIGTFTVTYSFIGNPTGAAIKDGTGNLNGDPKLLPLANNGGPTQTQLLLPDSPAINAGDPAFAAPPAADQRGFSRVLGGRIDMGAVEVNYSITATAGTPQSATVNTTFGTNLQATVTESGNPVSGISVSFTPPATGPSGVFSGGNPAVASTNGSGVATAPTFTANGTPGSYNVVASVPGISSSANFALTNVSAAPTTLGNISSRLAVGAGDNALIGGFILTGTHDKKVVVRALGPSLSLPDKLANPTLELRDSSGGLVQLNDDWTTSPNRQAIVDAGLAPSKDLESAIIATLPANGKAYTAIVRGAGGATGTGVVEVYDIDRSVDSKLANISTRGLVQTGDNVLIAGTIVVGPSTQKVIVRAIGPSLNLAGKLADPALELRDANGALVRADDNWRTGGQETEIMQSGVAPTNDLESALIETLATNSAYTAIVRGVNNTTGIAVVEVYALQ